MPPIGVPELLIVLVLAVIVLGPKRLPEAGRSLGGGLRGFKDAVSSRDTAAERAAAGVQGRVFPPAPRRRGGGGTGARTPAARPPVVGGSAALGPFAVAGLVAAPLLLARSRLRSESGR